MQDCLNVKLTAINKIIHLYYKVFTNTYLHFIKQLSSGEERNKSAYNY